MADKKKNPTIITIPNGSGQEFRVQLNSLNVHISVGATTTLVQKPGTDAERSFPPNTNDREYIEINGQLNEPGQLEKVLADNPLLAPFIEQIRAKFVAKYS